MLTNVLLGIVAALLIVLIILVLTTKNTSINSNHSDEIFRNELERSSKNITESTNSIRDKFSEDFRTMIEKMNKDISDLNEKINLKIGEGFKNTGESINKFNERLAIIDSNQEHIVKLNDQFKRFEQILGNNKQVGNFGEALLEQVLFAYFGDDEKLYQTQYTIKGEDVKPDGVVFLPNKIICIDSKFPVSFYQEYLSCEDEEAKANALKSLKEAAKKQITEVTKYIIKGVTDEYACMFIPSDALLALIYKKLPDVIEFARSKHIIMLSPSTIVPFISNLRIIRLDYERNKYVEKLYDALNSLAKEFNFFTQRWDNIGTKLRQLGEAKEELDITAKKLTSQFDKISKMNFEEEKK